jgi:hypothetical protein
MIFRRIGIGNESSEKYWLIKYLCFAVGVLKTLDLLYD